MKRLLEQEATAVMEAAARAIPARLRPSAFAIVADLLLADGKIDAREQKFLSASHMARRRSDVAKSR